MSEQPGQSGHMHNNNKHQQQRDEYDAIPALVNHAAQMISRNIVPIATNQLARFQIIQIR